MIAARYGAEARVGTERYRGAALTRRVAYGADGYLGTDTDKYRLLWAA